jgi:hypothetical protein
MADFRTGATSQSNVGFMTEVNFVNANRPSGEWHKDDFFALSYGRTREEAQARAERIAVALSAYGPAAPCGECHLKPGEICDICGAIEGSPQTPGAAHG